MSSRGKQVVLLLAACGAAHAADDAGNQRRAAATDNTLRDALDRALQPPQAPSGP